MVGNQWSTAYDQNSGGPWNLEKILHLGRKCLPPISIGCPKGWQMGKCEGST